MSGIYMRGGGGKKARKSFTFQCTAKGAIIILLLRGVVNLLWLAGLLDLCLHDVSITSTSCCMHQTVPAGKI